MGVTFIDFTCKCSYFEIFIVANRPYFVSHTIPSNQILNGSSRNLTPSHTTSVTPSRRNAFMINLVYRLLFLET